jgi:hypothetical protein
MLLSSSERLDDVDGLNKMLPPSTKLPDLNMPEAFNEPSRNRASGAVDFLGNCGN